jgi:hypothetical protein
MRRVGSLRRDERRRDGTKRHRRWIGGNFGRSVSIVMRSSATDVIAVMGTSGMAVVRMRGVAGVV